VAGDVAERRRQTQRPRSTAAFMPAVTRSDRTSLSNCANDARMPSMSRPDGESSIGSVTERSAMPRPRSSVAIAWWSALFLENLVSE
jgi:hypothetical protein